uniref:Oxysterol-binding protein n=1 Tax=Haemonchus contortus TaxID=6289 RepID=A0A7I5E9H0_HAECO
MHCVRLPRLATNSSGIVATGISMFLPTYEDLYDGTWSAAKSARKRLFRKRRSRKGSSSTSSQHNVHRLVMSSSSTHGGGGSSVSSLALQEDAVEEKAGWLNKWTNYLKGYRQRWFVLDSTAVLSYYRSPSEVGQSCRGSINLQEARILSDKITNNIVISASSQTFHLKAGNDVDRQKWLSALEYSRHKAIKQAESDEDEDAHIGTGESRVAVLQKTHKELLRKLEDLQTAARILDKHGDELIRCVNEPEIDRKTLSERAALLKITTAAVLKAAEEFVDLSDRGSKRMGKVVATERREKIMLQEQLETLAKQHSSLERAATLTDNINLNPPLSAYSDMEDEFHDAAEELSLCGSRRQGSDRNSDSESLSTLNDAPPRSTAVMTPTPSSFKPARAKAIAVPRARSGRERRTTIPDRPDLPINLWSIMKNCIGKELSKIPMPVNFSEPLSVLQRITEDLEYANLLETASTLGPLEQLAYVAAYGVSNYSTTGNRTNKPFNPLLGETYECDRTTDLGWRSITEQVSHHPPAAAHYAEGNGWVMYQDFTMTSRFRGKYLSVIPVGYTHVYFPGTKNHYSYKKITTTVHNIIVGKLWIDNHGDMEIINHGTGDKCVVKFFPYSYFSREAPRKVYGVVRDSRGEPHFVVQGTWDSHVDMLKVTRRIGTGDKARLETDSEPKRIWTVNPPPPRLGANAQFSLVWRSS